MTFSKFLSLPKTGIHKRQHIFIKAADNIFFRQIMGGQFSHPVKFFKTSRRDIPSIGFRLADKLSLNMLILRERESQNKRIMVTELPQFTRLLCFSDPERSHQPIFINC